MKKLLIVFAFGFAAAAVPACRPSNEIVNCLVSEGVIPPVLTPQQKDSILNRAATVVNYRNAAGRFVYQPTVDSIVTKIIKCVLGYVPEKK